MLYFPSGVRLSCPEPVLSVYSLLLGCLLQSWFMFIEGYLVLMWAEQGMPKWKVKGPQGLNPIHCTQGNWGKAGEWEVVFHIPENTHTGKVYWEQIIFWNTYVYTHACMHVIIISDKRSHKFEEECWVSERLEGGEERKKCCKYIILPPMKLEI